MAKYHIGKLGVPEVCRAKSDANCPYKGTGHYDTQAQAAEVSQRMLEEEYGFTTDDEYNVIPSDSRVLDSITYFQATYNDNSLTGGELTPFQHLMKEVQGETRRKRSGLEYETFGGYAYAQEMGLQNTIINDNGQLKIYSDVSTNVSNESFNNAQMKILKNLESKGIEVQDKANLIKVLHFSDDGNTCVAQMGGSDVLDLAIIENDKVEIVEFKRCNKGGAQLSSRSMSVDKNGKPYGNLAGIAPNVQRQVQRIGFKETFGTNVPVNLTNREALAHVVDSYKEKGADRLSYLNKRHEVVEVDLKGDTPSIVKRLEENNLKATIRLRSNLKAAVPTKEDKERWVTKRGDYFKSGEFPKDSFTIDEINPKYIKAQGETVSTKATVGELVLPYTPGQLKKLPKDTRIKVSELKVRGLDLIGEIKEITPASKKKAS